MAAATSAPSVHHQAWHPVHALYGSMTNPNGCSGSPDGPQESDGCCNSGIRQDELWTMPGGVLELEPCDRKAPPSLRRDAAISGLSPRTPCVSRRSFVRLPGASIRQWIPIRPPRRFRPCRTATAIPFPQSRRNHIIHLSRGCANPDASSYTDYGGEIVS